MRAMRLQDQSRAGTVWEIMTGAPIPHGADAVVMLEHVEIAGTASAPTIRLQPPRH